MFKLLTCFGRDDRPTDVHGILVCGAAATNVVGAAKTVEVAGKAPVAAACTGDVAYGVAGGFAAADCPLARRAAHMFAAGDALAGPGFAGQAHEVPVASAQGPTPASHRRRYSVMPTRTLLETLSAD